MLGYCRVVHATAHIMSQITVKHLGNYKLSPVNKLVDTCMRRNVNRNGFNGGCRGVGNVNIPHSNQVPHLTRACAETSIGTDLTPENVSARPGMAYAVATTSERVRTAKKRSVRMRAHARYAFRRILD